MAILGHGTRSKCMVRPPWNWDTRRETSTSLYQGGFSKFPQGRNRAWGAETRSGLLARNHAEASALLGGGPNGAAGGRRGRGEIPNREVPVRCVAEERIAEEEPAWNRLHGGSTRIVDQVAFV